MTVHHHARQGRATGHLRLVASGMLLIAVSYGLARYAYGLFVPALRAEFDLDAGAVGVIAAGSYASYCAAIVLATVAVPRLGARAVATVAGSLATGGMFLVATAPGVALLAVGVLLAGSSTGFASPPLADAVARTVAPGARDRAQAAVNAATGLGVAVAGPVALLTHEHWRVAWLAFAAVAAVVTACVALTVPSASRGRADRRALLPRPLVPGGGGRLMAAAALAGASSSAVWTFGRDVLVDVGEMDELSSTTAWTVLGVCAMLGAGAGDMVARLGIGTAWTAGMVAMGVATAVFALFPAVVGMAWLGAAAFGAVYTALTALLLIAGTRIYPGAPAAGVGIAFLVLSLGQALAAPVLGALIETAGARPAFLVAALVAVGGAFARPAGERSPAP